MIYKNTSVKEVISKVYRDLDLQDESRWQDMIEWSGEAIEQIGSYFQFEKVPATLTVDNYKVALPCGFHKLIDISYNTLPLGYLSGTFDYSLCDERIAKLTTADDCGFTINPGYINTNFENGEIEIIYLRLPIDDEGFPLIPDDISYREAVYWYIVMKLHYPKFLAGSLRDGVYADMKMSWSKYCRQARAAGNMPSLQQLESIKSTMLSLIPHLFKANTHFVGLNKGSTSEYNNL